VGLTPKLVDQLFAEEKFLGGLNVG
jgi:hypothetical protein